MNHKIIDAWVSSICGVFGFGISWTNIHWTEDIMKISAASFSALVAGAMGYIGKLLAVRLIRKVKSLIHSKKDPQ